MGKRLPQRAVVEFRRASEARVAVFPGPGSQDKFFKDPRHVLFPLAPKLTFQKGHGVLLLVLVDLLLAVKFSWSAGARVWAVEKWRSRGSRLKRC